jgi:hypothetical protein
MSAYSQEVKQLYSAVLRQNLASLNKLLDRPDATDALRDLLNEITTHHIYRRILRELVRRRVIEPIHYLNDVLNNASGPRQRYAAIVAVQDYLHCDKVVDLLGRVLYADENTIGHHIRNYAACMLALMENDSGLYPLAYALHHKAYAVRRSAIYGLSMSPHSHAITILLHYLESLLGEGLSDHNNLQWQALPIILAIHRTLRRKTEIPNPAYAVNVLSKWLYTYPDTAEPEVQKVLYRISSRTATTVVMEWQQWKIERVESRHHVRFFR